VELELQKSGGKSTVRSRRFSEHEESTNGGVKLWLTDVEQRQARASVAVEKWRGKKVSPPDSLSFIAGGC
jgi:hypothetical protein